MTGSELQEEILHKSKAEFFVDQTDTLFSIYKTLPCFQRSNSNKNLVEYVK